MLYRQLGKTSLNVSILGLGAMRLPINNALNPDYTPAVNLIRYAIEKGINFFDVGTFYCHNHCEKVFGLATNDIPSGRLIMSGKNSSHQDHKQDWTTQLQHSLSLFRRDHFDIYFIHYLNLEQWNSFFVARGIIHQINAAKKQRLFQYLGFSSHDKPDNVRQLIDSGAFEAVILPYNLLQREYEATMQYAYESGLGVIAMNPLAGGNLLNAQLYLDDFSEGCNQQNRAELALNYVLSQPFIHTTLSGMESKPEIDDNIRTVHQERLKPPAIERLNHCISLEKAAIFVPCTSCQYCLPCTQGIDIPIMLSIWNRFSLLQGKKVFVRDYAIQEINAECCIQCQACTEKCPQKIAIPEIMAKIATFFKTN